MGFTFMVLRMAFDADRSRLPRLMIKVRDATVPLMRFEVEDSCRRLGIDAIDVAQLTSMDPKSGNLVDQLRAGSGPLVDELASLRERGLIRQAVLYLNVGKLRRCRRSHRPRLDRRHHALLERLPARLHRRRVGSHPAAPHRNTRPAHPRRRPHRTKPAPPRRTNLPRSSRKPAAADATDFNLRLAASDPVIRTTIGGTSLPANLKNYLVSADNAKPLPPEILSRIEQLQTR